MDVEVLIQFIEIYGKVKQVVKGSWAVIYHFSSGLLSQCLLNLHMYYEMLDGCDSDAW